MTQVVLKTRSDPRTTHQKNVTGTANENWSSLRSSTGASELNELREDYERAKQRYASDQLSANRRSGQEKASSQRAAREAEEKYRRKYADISKKLDQRLSSQGYRKKDYPDNNSSGIRSSTLISDAKSAGVDKKFIEEYQNAQKAYTQAYKEAEKKHEQDKNSSGPKSLAGRMPWNYPEVEAANRRKNDLENLLVQALYNDSTLPTFYKKK